MNGLGLRVSSVKSNETVRKNAELRESIVKLPKQYQDAQESYCLEIKNAKTVPEQVACVKSNFAKASGDDKLLQFICDLFFNTPLKHPVRNQILKLLIASIKKENGSSEDSATIKTLTCSIHHMLQLETNADSIDLNNTIASISGCFENFEGGLKALKCNINQVFNFIYASIPRYLNELTTVNSPSVRNEYYIYIHNSIRVLLNCVQEFGALLLSSHSCLLKTLSTHCKEIILDGDIPMDPRTNAGILMAYIAKLFEEYPSFICYAKDIQNPHEIALCSGVINTCNQEDFRLHSIAICSICVKIEEIANANATVPNILLCATRALYQMSKLIVSFAPKLIAFGDSKSPPSLAYDVKMMLEKLMTFSVAYMEHHMDSVRHLCRDIVRNVVVVANNSQYDKILQNIYDACNSERLSLSVKCLILQQVALGMGADEIVTNCNNLFTKLFPENLGKDFVVNRLYEALMTANYVEQSFVHWCSIWIMYLLDMARNSYELNEYSRLSDIEALIVKAVKCDMRVVEIIICDDTDQRIPITTKLSTLWAVRKAGIQLDNYTEIMASFAKNLQLSILSNNDETRLLALRLLVETNKTTEPLSSLEFELILTYLQYNANCQSPETRQKSLNLLKKALNRCLVSLYKQTKAKLLNDSPLEITFLKDFMRILVDNLFDGANFSRRYQSLELLRYFLSDASSYNLSLFNLLPPHTVKSLVNTLADSYESNKELAVNMLQLLECQLAEGSLIENYQLQINLKDILILLTSVKPTDSLTACYQLEFLCHKATPEIFGDFEVPSYVPATYAALKWLLVELKDGYKLAKLCILEAAKLNPLYGLLYVFKHLLKKLDFFEMAKELLWRNLLAEIIGLCKDLTQVVAPIVNSSSPEGHLPNDFSELPEVLKKQKLTNESSEALPWKILSTKQQKVDMTTVKTTPQMVLLCAWRTVKEVSLILGDIVIYSPIESAPAIDNFLITKEQILEIGDHFKLLLSETKHRGAFEQAYVGFSLLCCRLWTVSCAELNLLPMKWLKELIEIISQEDINNAKICATRRSAGVPFMVQALITSELKVGSTKALEFCMDHLLELCSSKDKSTESRTHGLNILRALFRCTNLNDAVGAYVSDGVMVAIRGYDANNWSEKNSATLLFASLITRIFGVQLTKDSDNLNIRNKMTGRVFFIRYPKLYDFFLEELKNESNLIEQKEKAHKLHPLLLILSRLYPSALEGTESNLKLSEFIPNISKCGGCPEMQTRYLAAKAVVALINKDEVTQMLLTKCADIMFMAAGISELRLNVLHGYLLQIYFLLKNHKYVLKEDMIADITTTIVGLHEYKSIKNAVVLKVMLDIFTDIMSSLNSLNFKPTVIQQLLYFSNSAVLSDVKTAFYYPVLYKSSFLYNLQVLRLTLPTEALSDYILDPPITNVPIEQAETCLNIILLLLTKSVNKDTTFSFPTGQDETEMFEEFEIMPTELQFVNSLNKQTLEELSTDLKTSKVLYLSLKQMLEMPKYYPEAVMKCYAILSFLKHFDFTLEKLINVSKEQSENIKSPLTMCVERVLQTQGLEYQSAELCLSYLVEISKASHPYYLRLKAANSVAHLATHFPKSMELKRMNFLRLYIKLILDLLMDDDYDIRDYASKLVLRNLTHEIDVNISQLENNQSLKMSANSEAVVSTLAQCIFIQFTAEIMCKLKMDDDYILEIFKIIVSTYPITNELDDYKASNALDVEVFDKNDTNDFSEPMTAIFDAVTVFKSTFKDRLKVLDYVDSYCIDLNQN